MVSKNLSNIADEFDDMIKQRDVTGLVALGGIGAVGGVLAEMAQDRLAPRLRQPKDPNKPRGLAVSFATKAAVAGLLGWAALQTGGSGGQIQLLLGTLGVGAMIDSGVDLIEAGDALRNRGSNGGSGGSSAMPRNRTRARTRTARTAHSTGTSASSRSTTASQTDRNRPSKSVSGGQSSVPARI